MKNAFTVDVEDYYQVEAFASIVEKNTWENYTSRVEKNTHHLLDLLDEFSVKGTFFVLGWVAQRHNQLIRDIASRGHEIASHGMSHTLIYTQTPEVFRDETRCSKALLENICQQPVIGYRAATYSITRQSLWALDILCEEGFQYDSSIFPMRHDRYGIHDAYPYPHCLDTPSGYKLMEFPISVSRFHKLKLPVAGGGYFRLFPYVMTRWGLSRINHSGHEFVFYLHPWELDPGQPRLRGASMLSSFRHYQNLSRTRMRLERLLRDFQFTTMQDVLRAIKLL